MITVKDKYELAEDMLGIRGLLDALVAAMSTYELEENLDYIIRAYGIKLEKEEEE